MLKDNCRSFQNQQVAAVLSKKLGTSPLAKEQPFFSLKKISKMGVQGHFWGGDFQQRKEESEQVYQKTSGIFQNQKTTKQNFRIKHRTNQMQKIYFHYISFLRSSFQNIQEFETVVYESNEEKLRAAQVRLYEN